MGSTRTGEETKPPWRRSTCQAGAARKGAGKESHKKAICDRAPSRCLRFERGEAQVRGGPAIVSCIYLPCADLALSHVMPFQSQPLWCTTAIKPSSTSPPASPWGASRSGQRLRRDQPSGGCNNHHIPWWQRSSEPAPVKR